MSYHRTGQLAAEIRAELARQQISNTQLADATGIPRMTLWRRLRGEYEFTVDELISIADYLGLTAQELIDRASPTQEVG